MTQSSLYVLKDTSHKGKRRLGHGATAPGNMFGDLFKDTVLLPGLLKLKLLRY